VTEQTGPSLPALEQLARRLAEAGRFDGDARRVNELIVERDPANYPAHRRLARWHELAGDDAGRREWLQKALPIAPTPNDRRRLEELLEDPPPPPPPPAARRTRAGSGSAPRASSTTRSRSAGPRSARSAVREPVSRPALRPETLGDTMLIAVTTPAYQIYEAYGVHCTTMSGTYPRRFGQGEVERLGFVVRGTVQPLVPRIVQLVLSVPTRTDNLPAITRAGGDAHHVAEAIAEWRTRLGHAEDFARVFLLSAPDDADTLRLSSTVSKAAGEPDVSGSEFVFAEDLGQSGSLGDLRTRRAARATAG
jgi:hypothetical protein